MLINCPELLEALYCLDDRGVRISNVVWFCSGAKQAGVILHGKERVVTVFSFYFHVDSIDHLQQLYKLID